MAKRTDQDTTQRITRDDLERGFAGIQRGLQQQVEERKSSLLSIAAGIGVVVLVIVFLLGRRSGRKKTTFVEIRRV
jgi:hypothetical protein